MLRDEQIAGLIVFPLALIGVTANWTVAVLIRKLPSLKNSFGRLTASQSIGDAIHSTLFALYFAPMCFFDVEWMKTYSMVCGHLLLIAYDISTYSHFFISVNRFCSIVAPVRYDSIFSMSNTRKCIIFSWTMAILPSIYFYILNDCKLFYIEDFWVFVFSETPVCNTIVWYADFLKYNSIVILIVIIDVITVSKVRHFKANLSRTVSRSHDKKQSSEMNFLKQACLQAFVFVCELITYFILTPRWNPDDKWTRFFMTTTAWVCVHMFDGIITISFNKEFIQTVFKGIRIKDLSDQHNHATKENSTNWAIHSARI